jgi:hypothetical protein
MFAKIENGQLINIPQSYEYKGISYSNYDLLDEETLLSHGWKYLIDNPPEPKEGFYYIQSYIESGNEIVVKYEEKKIEISETQSAQLMDIEYLTNIVSLLFVAEAQREDSVLDETTILEHAEMFPAWDEYFRTEKRGVIVRDKGILYRNIYPILNISHNTKPSKDKNMWQYIGNMDDEFLKWSQPLGGNDAYDKGDKCRYNNKKYISIIDGNIYAPGVVAWEEVEE